MQNCSPAFPQWMQHCTGSSLVPTQIWKVLVVWWMFSKSLVLQRTTGPGGLGSPLARADCTQRPATLSYAKPGSPRLRLASLKHHSPTCPSIPPPIPCDRATEKGQLTLNLKSSWLAEPFMVNDWEMLQGEGSKDRALLLNPFQRAGCHQPTRLLGSPPGPQHPLYKG